MTSIRVMSARFASVIQSIRNMDGLFPSANESETAKLIEALMGIRGKTLALEIGTHFGFTTAHMIRAAYANGSGVFSTDIKDQRSKYLRILDDYYSFDGGGSHAFLEGSERDSCKFGFVFIDGNHDPKHVEVEFELLSKCIDKHCIIAIHDTILFPELADVSNVFALDNGFEAVTFRNPKSPFKDIECTGLTVLHRA